VIRGARVRALYAALRLGGLSGALPTRSTAARELRPYQPGLSVIIPERANPCVLAETVEHAVRACRAMGEPSEIIIVVNGTPAASYRAIAERHHHIVWRFSARPLWYSGAVLAGIEASRYDWVYLLNSDMLLDGDALEAVMRWRSAGIFAIASQVFFPDPAARREETGWTMFRAAGGPIEILDEVAPDDRTVRGTFYAGGGAGLFRRYLLRRLARHCSAYLPFYWEDVEWGARAWRLGYGSLYCPASKAWHLHRTTNRLFYSDAEIDRILRRNRWVFHFRNGPPIRSFAEFLRMLGELDEKSLDEILGLRRIAQIAAGRFQGGRLPVDHIPLDRTWSVRPEELSEISVA